jgi:MFS family permease
MLQAGSIIGSVIAFVVSDYLGRKRTAQLACILWTLGTAIWFTSAHAIGAHSGNLSQLLAGRFIAGLGVGITPVVAPTYLAEIAPRAIRGLCVCIFSGSVYIVILLGESKMTIYPCSTLRLILPSGYWSNYGTARGISDTNKLQWQVPAALNFIFAGIIFISSFWIPESPRWLLKVSRDDDARKSLNWLRNKGDQDILVDQEFETMANTLEEERIARGQKAWYHIFVRLITNRTNLHVLCIGLGIQVFGQFSGGG